MFGRQTHLPVRGALLAVLLCLAAARPGTAGETATAAGTVTEAEARAKALAMAAGGNVVRSETDYGRRGRLRYSYVILTPDSRVKVTVDGDTGEVVKYDKEAVTPARPARAAGQGDGTQLSLADARDIALGITGGGEVVKMEKDVKKSGRVVYDIEIVLDGMEHEFEIDGATGDVLEHETERLKDGKRRRKDRR